MRKQKWISFILIVSIVLSLLSVSSFQTVFATGKGKVTKIVSNEPTGITQEELRQKEPDFYSLSSKKTKKPKKRTDTVSRVKAKANKKQVLFCGIKEMYLHRQNILEMTEIILTILPLCRI